MKELIAIQSELNVPKSEYNSFSKFSYRTAEGILAAAKPILKKHNCYLNITDDVVLIGERYYVEALVTITNSNGDRVTSKALAREEETLKGMQSSQITGATSSYARKYALNGLFAIDDTKDADSPDLADREPEVREPKRRTSRTRGQIPAVATDEQAPELQFLNPDHENWQYVVKRVAEGVPLEKIKESFKLSAENERKLKKDAKVYADENQIPVTTA